MDGEVRRGRRPKGAEPRKAVTFRLQPRTIGRVKDLAAQRQCSLSDLIEQIIEEQPASRR